MAKVLIFIVMLILWIHQIYLGYWLLGSAGVILGIILMPVAVVTPLIEALFWWPEGEKVGLYVALYSALGLGLLWSRPWKKERLVYGEDVPGEIERAESRRKA